MLINNLILTGVSVQRHTLNLIRDIQFDLVKFNLYRSGRGMTFNAELILQTGNFQLY